LDKHAALEVVVREGWLSQTPASFQRAVLDRCLLERFETGTPIYSIGDEPGGMYGIVSGSLAISVAPREMGPYTAHFATIRDVRNPVAIEGEADIVRKVQLGSD
jgi:CRP/FNR family transcriptional regulator, cyclic AMP receptor protein